MMRKNGFLSRGVALILSLLMALPLGLGSAVGEVVTDVQYFITVSWVDAIFQMHTAQALPVNIPGYEDCYWVKVDPGTPLDGLQLEIVDFTGQYQDFSPSSGTLLPPVTDAGDAIDFGEPCVEIMAKTADGQPGALIYLYVSTTADAPAQPGDIPPAVIVQPVNVNIHYVDENGNQIADTTTQLVEEGTWPVQAAPWNLPENYHLNGDNYQNVTVTEFGADKPDVYFYYRYEKPAVQPVNVNVHYLDESGNPIADTTIQMVEEGTWPVQAAPWNLPENYHLNGDNYQNVTVTEFGADKPDVYFYYRFEKPAVQPVNVNVHYLDESGNQIADTTTQMVEEGTWPVQAAPWNLPENYHLNGDNYQNVTVTEFGADKPDVYFYYRYEKPAVQPVNVNVHYLDESGNQIADTTTQLVEEGTWPVQAAPWNLPENYHLNGDNFQNVTVTEFGADKPDVYFYYRYEKPAVQPVNVNVHYLDESGNQIADTTTQMVEEGTWPVYASPWNLPENYHLNGDNYQNVTVTEFGADKPDVYFYYRYEKPAVQPVNVNVHYLDESGNQIADTTIQMVEEGTWPVQAAPWNLPENYHLNGDNYQNVTVTEFGADKPDVYFYYHYEAPATPAPVHGTIRVRLLEVSSDRELYAYDAPVILGQMNDIYADISGLPGGYMAVGDTWQQIMVDEWGYANPAPVFYFINNATPAPTQEPFVPQPARITVMYLSKDDGMPVAMESVVQCNPGKETEIHPQPVNLLPGFQLVSEPIVTVTVDEYGVPNMNNVAFLYQYMEQEEQPPTVDSVDITIFYYSLNMQQVASPTRFTCYPGNNVIMPNPSDLLPGYELAGDGVQYITLNENGLSESTVTFYYHRTATPAPSQVRVQYLSLDGLEVAREEWVTCPYGQETLIQANPQGLLADYVLDGESQVIIRVDGNGPSQNQVVFRYRYSPNVPAPKVAVVPVKYVRPDGSIFYTYTETCVEGMNNVIQVDLSRAEAGYELASDSRVTVTVDGQGRCNPSEVVFQFRDEMTAYVTVFYQDLEGRNVASPQQQLCFVGNNSIMAAPLDLQSGYYLAEGDTQYVVLYQDGTLIPGKSIIFRYYYAPTASPVPSTPSPFPYEYQAMNGYCYPNTDNVNFRSEPSTAQKTSIIGQVGRKDLSQILGRVRNFQNEIWYHVRIGNQEGFLKENLVRVLTEAEIAALFNYTLAPTQAPTPAPTQEPDGVPIDRWAMTNAGGLNFRRTPASGNNVIRQISKNTRLWVYSSQTVDGEKWYHVRVNGTDGYLMAKFVDVYSHQESELLQQQMASPMPTQSPLPTPPPTLPPTQAPTLPPTQAPTNVPTPPPTASPAPYRGYALTRWMAALSTGASQQYEESVIEMLPADSLVYVEWQTYADGVAWSHVQHMKNNARGFMLHEGLRLISDQEAQRYLDALRPAVTASPEPAQLSGYAMTLGDGVPMRAFPDTNAAIEALLPYTAVASVQGQIYEGGTAWHMVQYNGDWGFIRQDQLRMMSTEEVIAYEESLRGATPEPMPSIAPTIAPVTQDSLTSYGHVKSTSGRVNLRSQPSKDSSRIRLLDNYAFALVLGTVETDEGTWYHVSQAGTEGYIHGDYFKVLSLGELSQFLQSEEYLNADSNNTQTIIGNSSTQLQPVEDYNQTVWKNPALNASYEPFNPYVTPTPNPEWLPSPTPTQRPTPAPTVYIAPVGPFGDLNTPAPTTTQEGGSPWPWVLLAIAVAGGGAAAYAYSIHRKNEQRRRQAMRAQQARQARAAAQQPQMRTAQNNPTQGARNYAPVSSASYRPPQSGAAGQPRQGVSQQTGRFPRQNMPPQGGNVPPTTNPFRPVTQQQADAYRASLEQRARQQEAGRAPQYTQNYYPEANPYAPVNGMEQPYASSQNQEQGAPARQMTQTWRPVNQDANGAAQQRQRRADRYQNDSLDGDA